MTAIAEPVAGVGQYLTALEQLAHAHQQLASTNPWTDALEESAPPEALDDLVATLCQHVRAAANLASAAESLCSALVAERYHLRR